MSTEKKCKKNETKKKKSSRDHAGNRTPAVRFVVYTYFNSLTKVWIELIIVVGLVQCT